MYNIQERISSRILIFITVVLISIACDMSGAEENSEEIEGENIVENTEKIENTEKTQTIGVARLQGPAPGILPLIQGGNVKNVILLIGDGAGLAQISSGQLAIAGKDGLLHMQTLPVVGFVKTHSADNLITDSAAGATAYSCGLKTYNSAIGLDANGTACKTILELAEERGLATGLVSTSSVTHATPASFAAHVEKRNMQEEIAADFLDSGVDVFLGGGLKWFSSAKRSDSEDLLRKFEDAGYQILLEEKDLDNLNSDQVLGLFANDGLKKERKGPSSVKMTEKALSILSKNGNGFFLMIEGSQIDWAGHANDAEYLLQEIEDFDAAVKAVLDFAVNDGETLVILTADHETGGLTMQRQKAGGSNLEIFWANEYHTGVPVPLSAYGPQSLEFMGWRDNTYVGQKLAELLNVGELPQYLN